MADVMGLADVSTMYSHKQDPCKKPLGSRLALQMFILIDMITCCMAMILM